MQTISAETHGTQPYTHTVCAASVQEQPNPTRGVCMCCTASCRQHCLERCAMQLCIVLPPHTWVHEGCWHKAVDPQWVIFCPADHLCHTRPHTMSMYTCRLQSLSVTVAQCCLTVRIPQPTKPQQSLLYLCHLKSSTTTQHFNPVLHNMAPVDHNQYTLIRIHHTLVLAAGGSELCVGLLH
jgi:hypothetical protein